MINRNIFFYLVIIVVTYSSQLLAEKNNINQVNLEVCILIDGSAEMVKKDPENIRAMILKEITEILPNNTLAGVWAFDSSAKSLIAFEPVNERWVNDTIAAAQKLNIQGTYKNIGEALEAATVQWTEPGNSIRKLILVTDGFTKVSDIAQDNDEAKAHILYTLLPMFKRNNIKLHIIGISDEVEETFLAELAVATDGSYHKIGRDENLNWLLLKIFDKSPQIGTTQLELLPSKALPIEENNFTIDEATNEVNLLVFREKANDMLVFKNPLGKVLDKNITTKNLHWQTEGLVDFVTIVKPHVGQWTIVGNLRQQNKFIVMNNLDVELSPLPGDMFVGESFMVSACLANNGKLVKNEDFLKSIKFSVAIEPASIALEPYYFNNKGNKDNKKNNYSAQLGPFGKAFKDPIVIKTNFIGKTFQRIKQQTIHILPVPVKVQASTKVDANGKQIIHIEAIPDGHVLDLKNVNMRVKVDDDQGTSITYDMFRNSNSWKMGLSPKAGVSEYTAVVQIYGETTLGRYVELVTEHMVVMVPEVTLPAPVIIKVREPLANGVNQDDLNGSLTNTNQESRPANNIKTMLAAIGILLGNVALLAGFIYAFRRLREKQQEKLAEVVAKIEGDAAK